MKIEDISINSLIPYARNSRTHSDEQVAQIAASIKEFGFNNPVLIDGENGIVAGHGRVMAARKLGLDTVPCIELSHLSDTQKRAYIIADNRLAETSEWDREMLALELEDIRLEGFDISLTGFDAEALEDIFNEASGGTEGLTDPDDAPEPQAEAVSKTGDVWLLGKHRLMCGDSTDAESVQKLMQGATADLCLTDPPYGLGDTESEKNKYAEYEDTKENLIELVAGFLPIAQSISPTVVLTPGNSNHRLYPAPNWTMAWFTPAGIGCGPWGFCCWQPILCYGKDPKLAKCKGRHPDAIVHTENSEKFGHPCTKPIRFWKWLMERTSEQGELIYEPFSGSGTTIIAAEQTGRRCYAMELATQYVDVAVRRWQQFTGKRAVLESTGEQFPDA
jgi:hypothetical protein